MSELSVKSWRGTYLHVLRGLCCVTLRMPSITRANFDWTYFNAAPDDQQLDGFLRGNEEVVLENLNPDHAVLKTTLPGIRMRCVVREGDDLAAREVQMNLDTLYVDSNKSELTLLWRGVADISDSDWDECREILVVSESLTENANSLPL